MSTPWVEKEDGPDCMCGYPTVVTKLGDKWFLLCLFHTAEAGQLIPLPSEKPDDWENNMEHLLARYYDTHDSVTGELMPRDEWAHGSTWE